MGARASRPLVEPEVESDGGFHAIDYIGGGLALAVVILCIIVIIRIVLGKLGIWQ